MTPQFQRILDLVRRTGDRLVVTDPDGHEPVVVMGLDAYESLLFCEHEAERPDEVDTGRDDGEINWKPEDYGDLVATESEQTPNDLQKAVENDLAVLDAWRKETEKTVGIQDEKNSELQQKSIDDEERFYLEPLE